MCLEVKRARVTRSLLHPLPFLPCGLPPVLGQLNKLRAEKEHSMSQVQELETSLAELRNQAGERGPGASGSRVGSGPAKVAQNGGVWQEGHWGQGKGVRTRRWQSLSLRVPICTKGVESPLSLTPKLSFFFFFFFFGHPLRHMEFLGQGSDPQALDPNPLCRARC